MIVTKIQQGFRLRCEWLCESPRESNRKGENFMQHDNWCCGKCKHRDFETGQFQATGGVLAKIFDVQNKKFSTVSCSRCGYTEVYKLKSSTLSNVLDMITG